MLVYELLLRYEEASFREIHSFQVKSGSILYIAIITRLDIVFTALKLSRHNYNPRPLHDFAADRVLKYLKETRRFALQFGGLDTFEIFTDASFADNPDRKSSQGYAMK